MTVKQLTLGSLTIALACLGAFRLGAQQEAGSVNSRYVLMQSEFQTSSNNTRLTERTVFKIDTATGKVWRFVSTVQQNTLETYWDRLAICRCENS
jgi:hypothetical protein